MRLYTARRCRCHGSPRGKAGSAKSNPVACVPKERTIGEMTSDELLQTYDGVSKPSAAAVYGHHKINCKYRWSVITHPDGRVHVHTKHQHEEGCASFQRSRRLYDAPRAWIEMCLKMGLDADHVMDLWANPHKVPTGAPNLRDIIKTRLLYARIKWNMVVLLTSCTTTMHV